jgi:predicted RNase H-like nuclease (RuvC/YqgF family)
MDRKTFDMALDLDYDIRELERSISDCNKKLERLESVHDVAECSVNGNMYIVYKSDLIRIINEEIKDTRKRIIELEKEFNKL